MCVCVYIYIYKKYETTNMTTFFTFSQEALTFVYIFLTRQNARQDILSREFLTMGTNFTIYFRIRNTALFTFVFLNTCSLYIRVFAEIYSIKLILSILIKIQNVSHDF